MQVALHCGAPYTDENRLQLCLGKNRERLAEVGTFVSRPSSYRKNLRPVLQRFKEGTGDDALREEFLTAVCGDVTPNRVVFSTDTFFGVPRASVRDDQFYPGYPFRMDHFLKLFDGAEVELFFAICNPATYLQSLAKGHPGEDPIAVIEESDPMQLRWSGMIARYRNLFPQLPITVWCNEDSPLIWQDIVRSIAGVDADFELAGTHDFLAEIMEEEGYKRFREYLTQRPALTPAQQKRVIAAFLEKFAKDELLEEDIDFPGWTDMHVDTLTELYDEDVYEIEKIPNIKLLMP
ncbi:hypothetical protein [Cognatishimia activa]|uniref:Sulfotransferase domain protein n=1 Tax=Cognatishimia activa TaxID=1715691 RepID=A0A0P1IUV7_9RHOB|nr:hypothetical protein [Cognatishimia activa]MEE2945187.1 hypothetical protein [Pseudomonadota bacterium]CUJ12821.1 hypothetical protein TA5113_02377 [Cognatishimia activa]CUK24941.1 hypothetical protein TA5114_00730 [Cognatishimia activa]